MVRCEEFYEKWKRCGNFCEKSPSTAAQIEAYLDEILYLEEIAAKSQDPKASAAMAEVQISERALRPLIHEKDPKVHKAMAEQVVNMAVEKLAEGKKILSGPEVKEMCGPIPKSVKDTAREIGKILPTSEKAEEEVKDVAEEMDNGPLSILELEPKQPEAGSTEYIYDYMCAMIYHLHKSGYSAEAIRKTFAAAADDLEKVKAADKLEEVPKAVGISFEEHVEQSQKWMEHIKEHPEDLVCCCG